MLLLEFAGLAGFSGLTDSTNKYYFGRKHMILEIYQCVAPNNDIQKYLKDFLWVKYVNCIVLHERFFFHWGHGAEWPRGICDYSGYMNYRVYILVLSSKY